MERSKRLEKEKNYLKSRNKFKSKNPDTKESGLVFKNFCNLLLLSYSTLLKICRKFTVGLALIFKLRKFGANF